MRERAGLRTARLELRPMLAEHLPLLVELDSDPEVLRHILGRARTPDEAREFWGPRCAEREVDGLGWWVGFSGPDFVGWWYLSPGPDRSAEAGWRLARRHWRQGLASEGAAELLRYGFADVGLDRVWAETMAVNAGSQGVMRRIGMRHVRTEFPEWDHPLPGADLGEVVYEITRAEWERAAR